MRGVSTSGAQLTCSTDGDGLNSTILQHGFILTIFLQAIAVRGGAVR